MASKVISVSRLIPASAQQIFDLLADPNMHPVLDGSGTVKAARDGNPSRLSLGAKFSMDMRLGTPYRITNTVVEFEEGRRIAWCHYARNIWRYELEPVDGDSTKVTESFDASKGRAPAGVLRLIGFFRRNEEGITKTLEKLEQHFASNA